MNLKDFLPSKYPENFKGGQCFQFLHLVADFPAVGDTLDQKKQALKNFGIPIANFPGQFLPGDILLTTESQQYGHGAMVMRQLGPNLEVIECNYKLDGKVHYGRLIPKTSPNILGVFRVPLKFKVPYNLPLQPSIQLIMNNQPMWSSMLRRLPEIQNWFYEASDKKVEILLTDPKYVKLPDWPLVASGASIGGQFVDIIREDWFDANVMPLSQATFTFLVIRKQDWKGHVFNQANVLEIGYCYEPKYPVKGFIICDENDDYAPAMAGLWGLSKIAAHEMGHGLYGIAGSFKLPSGTDLTHQHFFGLNGYPQNFADIFKDFDLDKLNLVINQ